MNYNFSKTVLFIIPSALLLLCCTKDKSDLITSDVYIRYNLDGEQFTYLGNAAGMFQEGVLVSKHEQSGTNTRYVLQGHKGTNACTISFVSNNLRVGNYVADGLATTFAKNGNVKGIYQPWQVLNITMTRSNSQTIDGLFSGDVIRSIYKLQNGQNLPLKAGNLKM